MTYNPYYNPYQQTSPAMLQQQQMRLQQQIDQMYPQYQQQNQIQQMPQSGSLNGRIIDSIDAVMANEIPMTGEIALFPTRDMQSVYAKQWQNDGTIKTVKYDLVTNAENVPHTDTKPVLAISDEFTEGIMKRFDELEHKIDSIGKGTASKPKKESEKS